MSNREQDFTTSFTADVLNEEPVVFRGFTERELKMVFLCSLVVGAPIGIGVSALIGIIEMALVFIILLPVFVVFFGAGFAQSARRGKPPGYLNHILLRPFSKSGKGSLFITSGAWSIGRTKRRRSHKGRRV